MDTEWIAEQQLYPWTHKKFWTVRTPHGTFRGVHISAMTENKAKLIAEAPDLLKCAEEMLAVLKHIDFSDSPVLYDQCWWNDWKTTINRAKGEI